MKVSLLIIVIMTFLCRISFAQTARETDSLISILAKTGNSRDIMKMPEANKIINLGKKVLPLLATFFTDSTRTSIMSDCLGFHLTKGEIAIILADRFDLFLPYYELTGIQNCTIVFCDNNPNLIEYYLPAIRRDYGKQFQKKYSEWLVSADRKKWVALIRGKDKKGKKKR